VEIAEERFTLVDPKHGTVTPVPYEPVKTIVYEYHSVTFSWDKTRIDEGVSNGRTVET
jgi:hypothetical protein